MLASGKIDVRILMGHNIVRAVTDRGVDVVKTWIKGPGFENRHSLKVRFDI